jgi:phage shock protein C
MSQENYTEFQKHLYRSRHDRMISGVCGGFAAYFNVEPLLVRLAWVLVTLFWGVGLILYIAAIVIMPENPEEYDDSVETSPQNNKAFFWGSLFILAGIAILLKQMGIFTYFNFWYIPWQLIWAVFLILIGVFLLYNKNPFRREPEEGTEDGSTGAEQTGRQIYRSKEDKMLAGVCSGLADYFNLDATVVRLAYVLISLASIGIGIVAYIVMILVFPEKPVSSPNGEAENAPQ